MPASVEMLPMFYANRRVSSLSKPSGFIDRCGAREMVEAGLALWTKGAKGIMLKKTEAQMYRPAPSLKPNIRTMDAFVEGKPHAVAIINAYAYRFAA